MAMSTLLHQEQFPLPPEAREGGEMVNSFQEPIGKGAKKENDQTNSSRKKSRSTLFGRSSSEKMSDKAEAPVALPIPAFGDLGKAANDLINKDFYHASQANLEVKLKAPNGTNVTVKGKQGFDSVTTASVEGKHVLKPHGVTITQAWTTASLLDSKVELTDVVAPGAKIDLQNIWNPSKASSAAQKLTFAYKNPNVHARSFINYAQASGNIDAVLDVTAGHEGFLVGGEAGYDLQKAAVTKYSLALGYQTPAYVATLTGTQNLSIIAASYYQHVNASTEVGAKVGYDVNAAKASGLELASKYRLDPMSFAKAKVNDRGIAALAYNTKLNQGTTLGLGLSLDLNKLNEAGHKIGTHLEFEG